MSGVEVAGLLLGAFPLMISALEHYRASAEVLQGWWSIKTEYRKCMRDLKFHKLNFENALEEFLLPLIADEKTLQAMLEKPGGELWKDPSLEAILRQRMPKMYSSYLDTIEAMQETLEELEGALGMSRSHFQQRVVREEFVSSSGSPFSAF
jgi:hypothetical protein